MESKRLIIVLVLQVLALSLDIQKHLNKILLLMGNLLRK